MISTALPTAEELLSLAETDPVVRGFLDTLEGENSFYDFVPRPDDPENFDQQHSFCFSRDQVAFLIGGNAAGCLGAEQTVFDPVLGEAVRVSEIDRDFHVYCLDSHGNKVISPATRPKVYGEADLYEVRLSNGAVLVVTGNHRMLSASGVWFAVRALASEPLSLWQSGTKAPCLSSLSIYEPHCSEIASSFLARCCLDHRRCDEPLHRVLAGVQAFPPSPIGARRHSRSRVRKGGRGTAQARILHPSLFRRSSCHSDCPSHPLDAWHRRDDASSLCLLSSEMVDRVDLSAVSSRHPTPCRLASQQSPGRTIPAYTTQAFPSGAKDTVCVTSVRFLRRDAYWDFTVPYHENYIEGNVCHHNTTEAAAFKCGQFLLHQQPPPRKDTPFWIIAETYEQVMDVCWGEKLSGHGHIPACEVDWQRVAWHSEKQNRPKSVPLKPWPEDLGGSPTKNWRLEFRSYEQGRQAMQARSIGGFWFSEQFPLDIFLEVLRGCREYMFPGGQFAEFTPIDPELSIWVEKAMEEQPAGWQFYRANTQKNIPNLQDGWYEQFFALVPEELRATRQTGALASFEGVIYPSFHPSLHVIPAEDVVVPIGAYHDLATDWGASAEHPHATVFGCRDSIGNWLIYDEYWSADQTKITKDHVDRTLEICEQWGWPIETYFVAVSRQGTRELKPGEEPIPGVEVVQQRKRFLRTRDALWGMNYGDPARPGEINEFAKRGVPTQAARNAVYEGINEVRTALTCHPETHEPRIRISSRCQHLIDELRKYRWKRGKRPESGSILNPQVATPVPLKRDDDTVDALRYLIYSKALPASETITSTKKSRGAEDRKSVQLIRNKLDRAFRRSAPGIMPNR